MTTQSRKLFARLIGDRVMRPGERLTLVEFSTQQSNLPRFILYFHRETNGTFLFRSCEAQDRNGAENEHFRVSRVPDKGDGWWKDTTGCLSHMRMFTAGNHFIAVTPPEEISGTESILPTFEPCGEDFLPLPDEIDFKTKRVAT
ncbi:MAG: hypothetical protein WAN50_01985 [Minisyncoccia bacterium]